MNTRNLRKWSKCSSIFTYSTAMVEAWVLLHISTNSKLKVPILFNIKKIYHAQYYDSETFGILTESFGWTSFARTFDQKFRFLAIPSI